MPGAALQLAWADSTGMLPASAVGDMLGPVSAQAQIRIRMSSLNRTRSGRLELVGSSRFRSLDSDETYHLSSDIVDFTRAGNAVPGVLFVRPHANPSSQTHARDDVRARRNRPRPQLPDWVSQVEKLASVGESDRALDVLFQRVDALFSRGEFTECDLQLSMINVQCLGIDLLVGLVTSTVSGASKMPRRPSLLKAVRGRILRISPERAPGIIKYLR